MNEITHEMSNELRYNMINNIENVIKIADKYNYDRDELLESYSLLLLMFSRTSIVKYYKFLKENTESEN